MKWFRDLKIAHKLNLAFLIMVLLIGIIAAAGYQSTRSRQFILDEVYSVRLPALDLLIEVDRDLQQLLVAERSMVFTDVSSDMFIDLQTAYDENLKQAEDRWRQYTELSLTAEELSIVADYEKAFGEWKSVSRQVVDARASDTREGRRLALDLTMADANVKFEGMRDYLDQLQGINLTLAEEGFSSSTDSYHATIVLFFIILAIGLIAGIVLAYITSRGITVPVSKALEAIGEITAGNLAKNIESDRKDEMGQILIGLDSMVKNLRSIVGGIQQAADQVSSSSQELSGSSQVLSSGASEQAANLEETSASIEQLSASIQSNTEQADSASRIASRCAERAQEGGQAVLNTVEAMKRIAEQITIIDDIADQTNLLALNAAIEAARAGEMGKGFAVVAVEVRKLAERSQGAAREISELARNSVTAAEDAGKLIQEVVPEIQETASLVAEIQSACQEQSSGAAQMSEAIGQLDLVTQQNASTSEESAAASEELSAQASSMMDIVSQFKLERGEMSRSNGHTPAMRAPHAAPVRRQLPGGHHIDADEVLDMD